MWFKKKKSKEIDFSVFDFLRKANFPKKIAKKIRKKIYGGD